MTAIHFQNVVKKYGSVEALRGISFSVERGEMFGLIGPDGAGTRQGLVGHIGHDNFAGTGMSGRHHNQRSNRTAPGHQHTLAHQRASAGPCAASPARAKAGCASAASCGGPA